MLATLFAIAITTNTAQAYLDPGAGSFVLQMLLAGALAVGASIKLFWYRIKVFCNGILRHQKSPSDSK
jgi:hypothetical protein